MNFLTPELLRDAADYYLCDGVSDSDRAKFSCCAIARAAGVPPFGSEFTEYAELLVDMGAMSGRDAPLPLRDYTGPDSQPIRYMLLHFVANYLETDMAQKGGAA